MILISRPNEPRGAHPSPSAPRGGSRPRAPPALTSARVLFLLPDPPWTGAPRDPGLAEPFGDTVPELESHALFYFSLLHRPNLLGSRSQSPAALSASHLGGGCVPGVSG